MGSQRKCRSEKSNGQELYTQQLFWNEKTRRIWSNVDSKIVEESGNSYIVEGFESDDQLKDWKFRRIKGRMWVNIEPTRDADSTSVKPVADNVSAAKEAVSNSLSNRPGRYGERPENSTDSRRK